jgi:hypothetical protein
VGLAEGVGFEPTEARTSAVFKTTAFVHSATPPLLNLILGPYGTDPELDLGVMPTHDVLLVGLRGGRPRIRQLGEGRLSP